MKKLWLILIFSPCLMALNAYAIETPIRLSSDARIETVVYSPYNVVPVSGSTFTTTQIIFGQDEFIENIQNGDLGAWTASVDKDLPYMMFVKPTAYNSSTNMTVVTNKHTYYFQLSSNQMGQNNDQSSTYAIKFIYPEDNVRKVEKEIATREQQRVSELSAFKNPQEYNWNYSFNGDGSIMPIHVFDDGKFTYMQLRPNSPVPAVFAIDSPDGKESVVNYRQDGQYLVIQQVAPQYTLRVGQDQVASIFNNKLISQFKSGT